MKITTKKITTLLLAVSFFVPSASFAAGLTERQAASLIAVVQSSPGTPASAFVSLITAFSNITVNQATSLIGVVQIAPKVPASAFTNLLISFTADVPQPQTPAPVTTPVTSTTTPSGTIPAVPATPAVPFPGAGIPAIPATPATPAQPTSPPAADKTPPIISNIQATPTETTATITWTTNESADSRVYLSATSPIPATATSTVYNSSMVTSRSINLANLTSSKTYYYLAVSKDSSGNVATSSEQSFTTLTPPPLPISSWSNVQITNFSGDGNIYYGEYPAITWNGSGYGSVWEGSDGTPVGENIFFLRLDTTGNPISQPVKLSNHGYCGCLTAYPPNISWNGTEYGVVWIDVQLNAQGQIQGNYLRLVTINTAGSVTSDQLIRQEDGQAGKTWIGSVNGWTFSPSYTNDASLSVSSGKIYFSSQSINNELVSTVAGSNSYPFLIWTSEHFAATWMNVQNNKLQLYFGKK